MQFSVQLSLCVRIKVYFAAGKGHIWDGNCDRYYDTQLSLKRRFPLAEEKSLTLYHRHVRTAQQNMHGPSFTLHVPQTIIK
jgi:hypothetical protein